MSYQINKNYILFLLFFYFVIFQNPLESIFPLFSYGDEFLALLAVPFFAFNLARNDIKLQFWEITCMIGIVSFSFIGIISNLIFEYQPIIKAAIPDLILNLKFWLSIYSGKYLFNKFDSEKFSNGIFRHIKIVTILFSMLFFVDNYIVDIFPVFLRNGFNSTVLFYEHPTYFASICFFIIVILLSIMDALKSKDQIYLLILLFLMASTMRSKALVSSVVLFILYIYIYKNNNKLKPSIVLVVGFLAIILGWSQIDYYLFSSISEDTARYQLLVTSIQIAKDYFPFGTGFGTFASHYSSLYYSPLYYIYGLSNVYGLSETGNYISDNFWPMILGQTGWFGLLCFIIIIYALYKGIEKLYTTKAVFYTSSICILIYLLISSSAESAFVSPQAVPLGVWLGYMLNETRIKDN